ncbi:MAG: TRAP transporter small permease [Clostridiales Family XIII bacterium]|nr:TRAP transporter small permease [Clostridiales Family XIII bacterium]
MGGFRKIIDTVCEKVSYVSMAVTFIMMMMTTVDVVLRKVSVRGINGSYELTEVGMVTLVFCAIAFLQTNRGQIRVGMLVERFPERARHFLEGVILLLSAAILAVICYATYLQIGKQYEAQLTTSLLHVPIYPFMAITSFGLLLYTLAILANATEEFGKWLKCKPLRDGRGERADGQDERANG